MGRQEVITDDITGEVIHGAPEQWIVEIDGEPIELETTGESRRKVAEYLRRALDPGDAEVKLPASVLGSSKPVRNTKVVREWANEEGRRLVEKAGLEAPPVGKPGRIPERIYELFEEHAGT